MIWLVYQCFQSCTCDSIDQDAVKQSPGITTTNNTDEMKLKTTENDVMYTKYVENNTVSVSTVENMGGEDSLMWEDIFDNVEAIILTVGFILNFVTFITFLLTCEKFSPLTRNLLRHQSFIDSAVCGIGLPMLLQPQMWTTGNTGFDMFVCQFWHGQAPYWNAVLISICNLVLISIERFFVVCKPFTYQSVSARSVWPMFVCIYLICTFMTSPSFFQTYFENGKCISGNFFPGEHLKRIVAAYGFYWFFLAYSLPVALFFILYGKIQYTLKKKKSDSI